MKFQLQEPHEIVLVGMFNEKVREKMKFRKLNNKTVLDGISLEKIREESFKIQNSNKTEFRELLTENTC